MCCCSFVFVNLVLVVTLIIFVVLVPPRALAFNNNINNNNYSFRDSWSIITLGDLHMEDDMTFHEQARQDCLYALQDYPLLGRPVESDISNSKPYPLSKEYLQSLQQKPAGELTKEQLQLLLSQKESGGGKYCQSYVVSLGDLGRGNKNTRHVPGDAGTSKCFQNAKRYLDGFDGIPYELVTGNHDLEGLEEFETDDDNLKAWMDCFDKKQPQFYRYVGERTLLLGLSTVQFRNAPYSSHEVFVDDRQMDWFQQMVESHPSEEGWKILVFSHAPIMGSGLRVIQDVHIKSGCAWLNHCCCAANRSRFIEIVQNNPQILCWSSGHFHLSHEYQDTLVQLQPSGGPSGGCTFVQVGVMGRQSTRDGRRQTRFFRGCGKECIEIYTINHHIRIPITTSNNNDDDDGTGTAAETTTKAEVRLDATIDLKTGRLIKHAYDKKDEQRKPNGDDGLDDGASATTTTTATAERDPEWFQAYVPQEEDGCYLEDLDGSIGDTSSDKVCWWHMADGKVLGLHQGQVVEYDAKTLAPLGIVIPAEQLNKREVMVVQNKTTLVLVNEQTQEIEVIHPNPDDKIDGSYWKKLSKSKVIRLEEQAREEVAKRWMEQKKQQQQ